MTVSEQDVILYLNTDDDEHTMVWNDEAANIAFCLEAIEKGKVILQVAEAVFAVR